MADDLTRLLKILARFADQIDRIAKSGDIARLREHAAEFQSFVESIHADGEFQARLREAELQALLDPLTGVGNRREFDRQIETRMKDGRVFCALLFDIDDFKAVNDRFGHLCGDEVLKQLGARLNRQVRTRDFVCRWGGDEFVVLLECGLSDAVARSRQITQWVNGQYAARETIAEITVSVGVAEHIRGETPEQLFERVDNSMYRQKSSEPRP